MEKLGINPTLLVVQIVNFVLLLLILKKVLYKPVLKTIAERRKKLIKVETDLKKIEETKIQADKKAESVVKKAKNDADEMIAAARIESQKIKSEALEKANTQAKKIISKAKSEADKTRDAEEKKLNKRTLELAEEILNKSLTDLLNEANKKETVVSAVNKLARLK
jgi:F-type H+-transporting ATPase subunit b